MRGTFVNLGLIALALTGCSRASDDGGSAAPDVPVTAAPGIAFAYRYAFALPADRVAAVQEAHARACEALGLARCRVTGFRYRIEGADSVGGQLKMRLAPPIARRFGQQGIQAVLAADGRLTDAQATGTDAEIDRLATEQATAAADQRFALASTPVTFDYASGAGLPLFDTGSPLRSAAAAGLVSARATLAIGLGATAILVPPALLVLARLLLARRLRPVRHRWFVPPADADT